MDPTAAVAAIIPIILLLGLMALGLALLAVVAFVLASRRRRSSHPWSELLTAHATAEDRRILDTRAKVRFAQAVLRDHPNADAATNEANIVAD
jgi:hypothetical protein